MRKIPGNTLKILEPVLIRSTLISPMVKYVVGLRAVRPTRTQVVQLHELIEGKLLNKKKESSNFPLKLQLENASQMLIELYS